MSLPLPRIVGHRGAMGVEPENTVRSFRRAIRDGAEAIELDLRASSDGALVICHDASVERTTNGTGSIADHTLAGLRELDAGEGERIPTFDEVLDAIDELPVQAELKAIDAVPLLARTIRERDLGERIIVTSFHEAMLTEARRLLPDVPRGLIFSELPEDGLARAKALGASLLCPGIAGLAEDDVEACHDAGIEVCGWMVNDAERMTRAIELGLDAVTSDLPGLMRAARADANGPSRLGSSAAPH